jgi:phage gpG-like protein
LGRLSEAVIARTVKTKLSGQVLKRRTGTLAKSLTWRLISDYQAVVGTNVAYAAIHEFGGPHPRSTTGKMMPTRPYLRPSMQEVFNSGEAQRIMNDTTNEYLNKEWTNA